jgi:hypothetical protein
VYSWPAAQEELLRTLTGVLCLDLATLYKGLTALERGVLLVLDLVSGQEGGWRQGAACAASGHAGQVVVHLGMWAVSRVMGVY